MTDLKCKWCLENPDFDRNDLLSAVYWISEKEKECTCNDTK